MQLVLLSLFVLSLYAQGSVPTTCAPCVGSTTMCCSKWGYCGVGPSWCGPGCLAGACSGDESGSTTRSPTSNNGGQTTPQPTASSVPQTARPTTRPAPGQKYLTAAILQQIMGSTQDMSGYVPHIQDSLDLYEMNTPLRIAAFLAQVRHETAGLTIFYQPADNGAGAIHMLPVNFRMACKALPPLQQAFAKNFPSCILANKCDCGDDITAGRVVAMNETTFLTGGWWMVYGSTEIMGWTKCGDLRINADQGLGVPGMPGTGYYEISRCIFGNGNDPGMKQRLSYYKLAMQTLLPDSPTATQPFPPTDPCNPPCAAGQCCSQYGYCGAGPGFCS